MRSLNKKACVSEDQWWEQFRPLKNHIDPYASFEGCMFETYGTEIDWVRKQPATRTWTVLDVDGVRYIANGFHSINAFGYLVTEVEYAGDVLDIRIDDMVEEES